MNNNKKIILILLFGALTASKPVVAHTGIDSHAGILSNIIAVGIVIFSIIIYLLISKKKERKEEE